MYFIYSTQSILSTIPYSISSSLLYHLYPTLCISTPLFTTLNYTNLLKFEQINKNTTLFTLLNPFYHSTVLFYFSFTLYTFNLLYTPLHHVQL